MTHWDVTASPAPSAGHRFLADSPRPAPNWLEDFVHPADRGRVQAAIGGAIRTRIAVEMEHRVRRVDGTEGWTLSRAVPLMDAAGEIPEWFGAATDIIARRRSEERQQ